jgi:hypothetical protein
MVREHQMSPHAVNLRVIAPVAVECKFWAENDGWIGTAEQMGITVRRGTFEEAKRSMETALAQYFESSLGRSTGAEPKSAA